MALLLAIGDGSTLNYGTSSGSITTPFANIESIDWSESNQSMIKVTKLADTVEQYVPATAIDYGMVKVKLRFISTLVSTVRGWQTAKTIIYLKLGMNDAGTPSTDVVETYLEKCLITGTVQNGKETLMDLTFRVTGVAPTFAAGS